MKDNFIVRNILFKFLSRFNLSYLFQNFYLKNTITIVTYHAIVNTQFSVRDWCFLDSKLFRMQIAYLRNNFTIVSLSDAVRMIIENKVVGPTAAITFDDGFKNNFEVAFPILKFYGIPATIFLTTKLINSNDTVWYCKIYFAFLKTKKSSLTLNGIKYDLTTSLNKTISLASIQNQLKTLSKTDMEIYIRKILDRLKVDIEFDDVFHPFEMLNSDNIQLMAESGLIEFGAHTHTHTILTNLSLKDKEREICESISHVESLTGNRCRFFAYPNGGKADYDEQCVQILKDNGIQAAVTMLAGPNHVNTNLMHMNRYGIGFNTDIIKFQAIAHHMVWLAKKYQRIMKNFIK